MAKATKSKKSKKSTGNQDPLAIVRGEMEVDLPELASYRTAVFADAALYRSVKKELDGLDPGALDNLKGYAYTQWMLGRSSRAMSLTRDAGEAVLQYVFASAALDARSYETARKAFEALVKASPKLREAQLGLLACLRRSGDLTAARALAKKLAKTLKKDPDFLVEVGQLDEAEGEYAEALSNFEEALGHDDEHAGALFRIGYHHSLRGDEERALECYEKVADLTPTYVNALVNLGVLYEDRGEYEEAIRCFRQVIKVQPTHRRARMYLSDCEASLDMFYDEEKARRMDKRSKLLKTPVTDFELSVRARNCLNKMNIRNLGDLIQKSEAELLSYKNFGETSLKEINDMLAMKGLRLGQGLGLQNAGPGASSADRELLDKPVAELELSVRSRKCMEKLKLRTLGELMQKSEGELLTAKNFGQTSLNEVKVKLSELGLALRTSD